MPKFTVKFPIEIDGKLYLPEGSEAKTAKSRGNGQQIPVDATGAITLTAEQAGEFTRGQIQPIIEKAKSKAPALPNDKDNPKK